MGEVFVVAPRVEQSGVSQSITFLSPLFPVKLENGDAFGNGIEGYSVNGTPVDCLKMAISELCPFKPDLVLSGINTSANLGDDATYSGTVMAAMEGMIQGVPSIAFSQDRPKSGQQDFAVSVNVVRHVLKSYLNDGLPEGVFLNVNVPDCPAEQLKGIKMTHQGKRIYHDRLDQKADPRGGTYYWIGGDVPTGEYDPKSDIGALVDGYASITPLQGDLSARVSFNWGK